VDLTPPNIDVKCQNGSTIHSSGYARLLISIDAWDNFAISHVTMTYNNVTLDVAPHSIVEVVVDIGNYTFIFKAYDLAENCVVRSLNISVISAGRPWGFIPSIGPRKNLHLIVFFFLTATTIILLGIAVGLFVLSKRTIQGPILIDHTRHGKHTAAESSTVTHTTEPSVTRLRELIELGAFDEEEASSMGLPRPLLDSLCMLGVFKKYGSIYHINYEALTGILNTFSSSHNLGPSIPIIAISENTLASLGALGVKNIILLAFHPRIGPTPLCSIRETKFSRTLFSEPQMAVTITGMSRSVSEARMEDSRLILRTYTTKHNDRMLTHVICAEVSERANAEDVGSLLERVATILESRGSVDPKAFAEALEEILRSFNRAHDENEVSNST